jgi:hypothetical protein
VDDVADVLAAAEARATALAEADAAMLEYLLHDSFRWTSHSGESFDRDSYITVNTTGRTRWVQQDLGHAEVIVVADAAILLTEVTDTVEAAGRTETFRMPLTQVWVRAAGRWQCLAGHAGPAL